MTSCVVVWLLLYNIYCVLYFLFIILLSTLSIGNTCELTVYSFTPHGVHLYNVLWFTIVQFLVIVITYLITVPKSSPGNYHLFCNQYRIDQLSYVFVLQE